MTGGCVHGWGVPFPRDIPCACFQHSSGLCLQQGSLREALHKEFKCQHPPATAHISQGLRQHEVRGCPPPRGDAHRLDGAASRHRLVLPAHPRHLRHSQPTEQMRQQLAVPPPPEVLPGCLRQEMPLAPAWHPHVPRVRARLLRIPVPPPVPARCSQPGEDCPAGDRDGDSSLPTL
ncbi:hypothetical protein Anapl_02418 [Anas platyrhynchos]|uniref:Uncharacterized protein n=1 Tax=Anas platyrhynchos TaxID=8839 RepID=R0LT75_ANAPL|nr:hypothetical protein Anapl_02418 [Anas platyrhynchos]